MTGGSPSLQIAFCTGNGIRVVDQLHIPTFSKEPALAIHFYIQQPRLFT
jgi:hypothetical protein